MPRGLESWVKRSVFRAGDNGELKLPHRGATSKVLGASMLDLVAWLDLRALTPTARSPVRAPGSREESKCLLAWWP